MTMKNVSVISLLTLLSASYVQAWTATGGGDHEGADWTIDSNIEVAGVHTNIGTFRINSGRTATVQSLGNFVVTANVINVVGTLSGDESGNLSGVGVGKGTSTDADWKPAGGGGYGGAGGDGRASNGGTLAGGTDWGNSEAPDGLGSGGGSAKNEDYLGGAGGGAIKLYSAGALTVDGVITANGGNGAGNIDGAGNGGGGSGGSIWLTCASLSGAGSITANGGLSGQSRYRGAGGGGGRIAVYFDSSTFSGSILAKEGNGTFMSGGAGTIHVNGPGWLPTTGGDHGGANWHLTSDATVGGHHSNVGAFIVDEGVTVTVAKAAENVGIFHVESSSVDISGILSANSQGRKADSGTGQGTSTDKYAGGGGGGGYGGAGGNGGNGAVGGAAWGNPEEPDGLGASGGGDGSSFAGIGGGAIRLECLGNVVVNGTIRADGGNGTTAERYSAGGGGSGGSIWISCNRISGTGSLYARGGNGADGQDRDGGGGGGGRIAIYSGENTFPSGSGAIDVSGGSALGGAPATDGAVGTLHLEEIPPSGTVIMFQ